MSEEALPLSEPLVAYLRVLVQEAVRLRLPRTLGNIGACWNALSDQEKHLANKLVPAIFGDLL